MRKTYFLAIKSVFVVFAFLMSSCVHSEKFNLFYEAAPNKIITSMGVLAGQPFSEAVASYKIDVNKDGINDYEFIISHSYADSSAGRYYDKFVMFIGSNGSNLVSMADTNSGMARTYSLGDELHNDFNLLIEFTTGFENLPKAYIYKQDETDTLINNGDIYLGVKMFINNKPHFGWILLNIKFFELTIKEYSISMESDKWIKIGEK